MQAMNSRTGGQHEVSWGCRLATYSTYWQQCGLWTAGLGSTWGILAGNYAGYEQQGWGQREVSWCCRLATYSIYWQQCGLWTAGLGVNMRYLGAVGWQPRALIGNNAGYEQQGWGQHEVSWGCRLATYSTYWQQCRPWTAGLGVNVRYLGAVGWQPRALIGNNAGYEQQGWGQR